MCLEVFIVLVKLDLVSSHIDGKEAVDFFAIGDKGSIVIIGLPVFFNRVLIKCEDNILLQENGGLCLNVFTGVVIDIFIDIFKSNPGGNALRVSGGLVRGSSSFQSLCTAPVIHRVVRLDLLVSEVNVWREREPKLRVGGIECPCWDGVGIVKSYGIRGMNFCNIIFVNTGPDRFFIFLLIS